MQTYSLRAAMTAGAASMFVAAPASGSDFIEQMASAKPANKASFARSAGSNQMDTYSRAEIDAILEASAANARTGQVASEGKLDRALDAISRLSEDLKGLRDDVRSENRTTRWSIWGLGVAMAAIILGVLAFAATSNGNIISAFSAGQGAATVEK